MLNSSRRKTTLILLATVATDILCLHGPALAADLFLSTGSHTVSGTETYEQLRLGVAPTSGDTVLNIGTGAILNSGTREGPTAKETFVGIDTGSNSIINVTGPNAVWNDNGTALLIGYLGEGKVNISSGGTVSVYQVRTSTDAGTGSISITDSGSKLTSESHVNFKKGTFEVKNGAELETVSGGIYLNSATFTASGSGTNIKIGTAHSGTPADWESADGFFSVESGTATISDGATLESDAGYVNGDGVGDENKASMTVTGENTTWNAHLSLYVGGSGNGPSNNTGELTVSGGAHVWASVVGVGNDTGSTGSILVTGSGTKLSSISDTFSGKGYIGVDGTGTITVQNGATFAMADVLRMGFTADANGTLNIGADANSAAVAAGTVTTTNGVEFYGGTSTIIFNHTETDYEFANAMVSKEDGKGTVRTIAGTTRLTGDNTSFTGTMTLSGGTLSVASQANLGSANLVLDGGTLASTGTFTKAQNVTLNANKTSTINTANNTVLTLAGAVSGTGSLNKTGSGQLLLTGNNSYAGDTTVSQGTFGGTGTLGALSVLSGANHTPGNNGVGTQTVNGNYALNSGSTLKIEINDTGSMDKVVVQNNGTVTISGASLSIAGLQGNFAQNEYVQVIIDNQSISAINGTFASVTDDLAFYDASVNYAGGTGNDVTLTLKRNTSGYVDVAKTPNQKSVATVLNSLQGADTLLNNLLSLSEEAVQEAYTQLTGNIYPITQQSSVNLNQQVSQQVGTRLTALRTSTRSGAQAGLAFSAAEMAGFAQPQGMIDVTQPLSASLGWSDTPTTSSSDKAPNGLWSQTVGGRGIIDADAESVKTSYDWLGIIGGYDRAITQEMTLGVFFGYINGNSEQSAIRSRIDTDTFTAGIYGEYRKDDWRASGQLAWSRIASDSRRDLKIGGFDQSAKASYTDQSLSADAELARAFQVEQNMWFEPYVSASVLQQYLGEFTETGAPGANLGRDDDTDLVGTSSLGVRFSSEYDIGNRKKLLPQLGLALKHHIGTTENSSTLHFTSGGSDFVVNGTPKDRNMLAAKIGTALKFGDSFQAFASYNPSFGARQTEHSFILGGRFEW
ncbi:hypothetical protein TH25_11915 [Thalassospira profundimaris]|uniref:Autotransporter domain-containing protein n=1 Tax=Thalassospira profundimaris TaxID=502049 RepID=A0A367XC01_9PROT|nr:autotransporter outer membrane beta-barrel domain-containing protein [Thalassospira profundimaris]RCK50301.1 hypothetical protein TH25_11915 [Thalassospira profundimaris]